MASASVEAQGKKKNTKKSKPKLVVWNSGKANAVKNTKRTFKQSVDCGRINNSSHPIFIERKQAKINFGNFAAQKWPGK